MQFKTKVREKKTLAKSLWNVMISPTLFRFVWMYICLIKKKIVLQDKTDI